MSATLAMPRCAICAAMLTMVASTRWAMKPGLSLMTVTGTPSAASRPQAASRAAAEVSALSMSVRRRASGTMGSTATVRAASRPSAAAAWLASPPQGCTTQTSACAAPSVSRAPAPLSRAISSARPLACGSIHTATPARGGGTGRAGAARRVSPS